MFFEIFLAMVCDPVHRMQSAYYSKPSKYWIQVGNQTISAAQDPVMHFADWVRSEILKEQTFQ